MKTIMETRIVPLLAAELEPLGLLEGGAVLLAGVSGGADSLALLYGLACLRGFHGFSLAAAHVEHGIRGEESQKDADHVARLCQSWNIPLLTYPVDAPKAARDMGCGLEEAARTLRYNCFRKAMAQLHAQALLLAHHGDDQAETVLMRLVRGGGPTGLAGMRLSLSFGDGLLVRPLLSLGHQTLVQALSEEGIPWREDATNRRPEGLRNSLRLRVMPVLTQLAPGCVAAMGRAARVMAAEEDWWEWEAHSWLEGRARFEQTLCILDSQALAGSHEAFGRRIIRAFFGRAMEAMGLLPDRGMTSLSFQKTEELLACMAGAGGVAVNLPGDVRGERGEKRFYLISPKAPAPPPSIPLSLAGQTQAGGLTIYAASWRQGMALGDGIRTQALDAEQAQGAHIRPRLPGDQFPLMGGGTKPLQEVLMEKRVDRPLRAGTLLVAKGNQILWIPGVGPSALAAIRPDTKAGVLLSAAGSFPWEIPGGLTQR